MYKFADKVKIKSGFYQGCKGRILAADSFLYYCWY